MSYTKQNFADGQKLSAKHLNHIENYLEKMGDGTWESMPDKPFGITGAFMQLPNDISEDMIIKSQILNSVGVSFDFVKVGDCFNSPEGTIGATMEVRLDNDGENIGKCTVDESYIIDIGNGFALVYTDDTFMPFCLNVTSVGNSTLPTASFLGEDVVIDFTETGFYFIYIPGMIEVLSYTKGEIKKINKVFLPDDMLPEGVVITDKNGLIPASKLPSYVDDVVEGYRDSRPNYGGSFYEDEGLTTSITGESGKIYVDLFTGNTYRWSGSRYVCISPSEDLISRIEALENALLNS